MEQSLICKRFASWGIFSDADTVSILDKRSGVVTHGVEKCVEKLLPGCWHKICVITDVKSGVKKLKPLEIASWAKAEQRAKRRAERRAGIFSHVRWTFIILFFATIVVFIHNHQVEATRVAGMPIYRVVGKSTLAERLQDKALNYEKNIDTINQPNSQSDNQPKTP
jgi:hypothetical protein